MGWSLPLPPRSAPASWGNAALSSYGFLFLRMWSLSAVDPPLKALLVLDPGTLRSWQRGLEGEALPGAGYGGTVWGQQSTLPFSGGAHQGPGAPSLGLIPFSAQLNSGEGLFLVPF